MRFYETVFLMRQEVTSADVDKTIEEFTTLLNNDNSKVIKTEYWGIMNLAYDINNNKKAHYVLLCSESTPDQIRNLEHKMKFNEDILRYMSLKVDSISKEASPILKEKVDNEENTVNVTAS